MIFFQARKGLGMETPTKKKMRPFTLWSIIIGTVVFIIALNSQPEPSEVARDERSSVVRGTAMEAVRARLKDGDGAEFDMASIGWNERRDGAVEASGKVRSQNSFGAMLTSKWHVVMREIPAEGKWNLLWISIGGQSDGVYPADLEDAGDAEVPPDETAQEVSSDPLAESPAAEESPVPEPAQREEPPPEPPPAPAFQSKELPIEMDSLTLKSGEKFTKVIIKSVVDGEARIIHSGGAKGVALDDFTEADLERLRAE